MSGTVIWKRIMKAELGKLNGEWGMGNGEWGKWKVECRTQNPKPETRNPEYSDNGSPVFALRATTWHADHTSNNIKNRRHSGQSKGDDPESSGIPIIKDTVLTQRTRRAQRKAEILGKQRFLQERNVEPRTRNPEPRTQNALRPGSGQAERRIK
jgi:hypothetical protein